MWLLFWLPFFEHSLIRDTQVIDQGPHHQLVTDDQRLAMRDRHHDARWTIAIRDRDHEYTFSLKPSSQATSTAALCLSSL